MIYPPRPESAVDPSELGRYENLKFWGQYKKNGTYTVEEALGHGELLSYTRHREPHKSWDPCTSKALEPIRDLAPVGTILCGELLHSKVSGGHKDTIYLHDIVSLGEEDMFGETYRTRYAALLDLFKPEDQGDPSHLVVTPNLWVARNLLSGFLEAFNALKNPEDEGFVLKNPDSRLALCNKKSSNSGWQVKCRVPHANYSF
jgi:hypothetical protein